MAYRDAEPVSVSKNRFSAAMARCGDVELVGIVEGSPDDWEPEALAAAHVEIQRRALSFEVREAISNDVEVTTKKARAGLVRREKALAFGGGVFGLVPGIVALFMYSRFQRDGFHQKSRDLLRWFGYGIVAHLVAIFVFAIGR